MMPTLCQQLSHFVFVLILSGCVAALWPMPRALSSHSSAIKLAPDFQIHLAVLRPPADLVAAVSRTRSRLASDSFERLVLGRSAADAHLMQHAHVISSLTLTVRQGHAVRSIADETNQAFDSKREMYSLYVPLNSTSASLTADSTLGLFRGLATFEQLWYDYRGTKYSLEGDVEIHDQPAFVCNHWSSSLIICD